jgi:hypothetical protein
MRFPSQDVLNPTHDTNDEACHASPSRDLATHKLTLDATRACDKSDSFHLDWLNEVLRGGRPGMRMISIAPHLIKPLQTETLHVNTHKHTHHHHGPDVHLGGGFVDRHDEDADATHDDNPHDSSHSALPLAEPESDSACGTEAPLLSCKLRARSAVEMQALLSAIADDGDDISDGDDIDIGGADSIGGADNVGGADISVVTAILRDAEVAEQLRSKLDEPPPQHTRRRAGQLAVLKVLQQRRADMDLTQLERQRYDFERRFTPDPSHPQPSTVSEDP